uniref:Uncharacterized protein n=1 Tax=Rhinopithecus bieti TaxID=61621 RepID=A0A2K6KL86_RHIBE
MRGRRVGPAAGARAGALPEAIAALSRSLPSGPSPEIFRRAKFDRPDATSALWQLLFRVLSPFPAGSHCAPRATRGWHWHNYLRMARRAAGSCCWLCPGSWPEDLCPSRCWPR